MMDGCKGIQNEMPKSGFEKNSPRVNFFKQWMGSIALLHLRDDKNKGKLCMFSENGLASKISSINSGHPSLPYTFCHDERNIAFSDLLIFTGGLLV